MSLKVIGFVSLLVNKSFLFFFPPLSLFFFSQNSINTNRNSKRSRDANLLDGHEKTSARASVLPIAIRLALAIL